VFSDCFAPLAPLDIDEILEISGESDIERDYYLTGLAMTCNLLGGLSSVLKINPKGKFSKTFFRGICSLVASTRFFCSLGILSSPTVMARAEA